MKYGETADAIDNVEQLEDLLSQPSSGAIESLGRLDGDLMLLGVGGKMGPTLARMARRAADAAGARVRVIGVSRFSSTGLESRLTAQGVETIRCDLTNPAQLKELPDAPHVIFMTGMKFGSTGNEAMTWMMNAYLPGMVCQRFASSRIAALSSGNVYGLSPVVQGGSVESDSLRPVGEYAMSAVGRERIFEHFSRALGIPMALLRLNYANELRYGVLSDLARAVWNEQPVELDMGSFNAIWQADANAMVLQSFDHLATPPRVLNLAGPELLSVRRVAEDFGRLLGKRVTLRGHEAADALLSNAQLAHHLFGYPRASARQMVEWIAEWVRRGGESLDKPTHFQVREGNF
ncbi:MAG: NAD-dependent epimerase/dehydratase family protein [Pirellulales bacterium]